MSSHKGNETGQPMSKMEAYMKRKAEEAQGQTQVESKPKQKKGLGLFLMGLLIVLGGSFCNGLLIHFEVGGIAGGLVRELFRLLIIVGLFMMVVSVFRKFWKAILVLFVLGVAALVTLNILGSRQKTEPTEYRILEGKVVNSDPDERREGERILQKVNESLASLPKGALDPYLDPNKDMSKLTPLEKIDPSDRDWTPIRVGESSLVIATSLGNPDYVQSDFEADGTKVSRMVYGTQSVTIRQGKIIEVNK